MVVNQIVVHVYISTFVYYLSTNLGAFYHCEVCAKCAAVTSSSTEQTDSANGIICMWRVLPA